MSFVRNAWYVAGWSTDFGDELVPLTLLAQNLVAYRTSDGQIAVLEDRCPHRLLPLSKGKRIGDTIQCGYHGMTFGADGACVRVPGQSNLPKSAYVDSYPVLERYGIVFIWMGDADKADPALAFDMPELGQGVARPPWGQAAYPRKLPQRCRKPCGSGACQLCPSDDIGKCGLRKRTRARQNRR